jgi:DNA-binding NarL/FixJ family response regulator
MVWWQLQRAVAAGDPDTATTAAEQLTALAEVDSRFQLRAMAAREWASVLRKDVDPRSIARTGDALSAAGQPWDAAALCGAAAGQLSNQAAAKKLLGASRSFRARITTQNRTSGDSELSGRERAVGGLLLDGLTHKEIGARLFISPKTVEQHVARLRQKLMATNRSELVAALRAHLESG